MRIPLLILTFVFSALVACDSETQSSKHSSGYIQIKPVPKYLQNGMPSIQEKETLSIADNITPAEWLLAKYQQTSDHDPARTKAYYKALLRRIQSHVHENDRVIANRVVQMTNMLNENAMHTNQEMLLTSFANYLESAQKEYVFGEIIDNYNNIRTMGLSHEDAMKKLFELLEG